jgi:hypothetical protein
MRYINFSYLYRDGGNNKKRNTITFFNSGEIDVNEFDSLIRANLIDGHWFYVNEWFLPDLHFEKWDERIDHGWHEFEEVFYSDEVFNAPRNLIEFVEIVKKTSWYKKKQNM